MPKLVRIYNLTPPDEDKPALAKRVATLREKRLFVAFSLLMSFNVLLFAGLATFIVLLRR